MTYETAMGWCGAAVLVPPLLLLAAVGLPPIFGRGLSESFTHRCTWLTTLTGLAGAVGMLALMLASGVSVVPIDVGHWVVLEEQHFHFHVKFVFDRLSIPFLILSFLLCGTVSAFTSRYLHRERGFVRFYVGFALFLLGMTVTSIAGTIEVLFAGWELVGLSSALLVAFYHERTAPVENGLRIWAIYRLSDAAFLIAAVALHHLSGGGDFQGMMGTGSWPGGEAALSSHQAFGVGLLLLMAAAGKSALVPFSGWLPRAMEGPTPSSAIFYGALSVHLGAFLLLRVSPLLDASPALAALVVGVGLVTALMAALSARTQTDIKSALAYASLIQVGLIVAEIGLGLRYVALVHIVGHASLRTLQLLRAPTLLHDYRTLEDAVGGRFPHGTLPGRAWFPARWRLWLYRFGLERGYLDSLLETFVVAPFSSLFRWFSSLEERWLALVGGGREGQRPPERIQTEVVDELRL